MSWVRVPAGSQNMPKYKVLKHFRWGDLELDAGQFILIEKYELPGDHKADGTSKVSVEHYPDKSTLVSTKAVEGMILLEKIEAH